MSYARMWFVTKKQRKHVVADNVSLAFALNAIKSLSALPSDSKFARSYPRVYLLAEIESHWRNSWTRNTDFNFLDTRRNQFYEWRSGKYINE